MQKQKDLNLSLLRIIKNYTEVKENNFNIFVFI